MCLTETKWTSAPSVWSTENYWAGAQTNMKNNTGLNAHQRLHKHLKLSGHERRCGHTNIHTFIFIQTLLHVLTGHTQTQTRTQTQTHTHRLPPTQPAWSFAMFLFYPKAYKHSAPTLTNICLNLFLNNPPLHPSLPPSLPPYFLSSVATVNLRKH